MARPDDAPGSRACWEEDRSHSNLLGAGEEDMAADRNSFMNLIAVLLALVSASGAFASALPELQLGTAALEITPPVGWRIAGNYYEQISDGVHDPLFAKAMVWQQGKARGALLIADLCSIGRVVSNPARERANELTGIPIQNISICGSHTHGGPEYYGLLRDIFHEQALAQHGADPHEPIDYQGFLVERFARSIEAALKNMQAVQLVMGAGQLEGLAFNRRYRMSDGTVRFNPARMDPEIVEVAGPVDTEFPIVLFQEKETERPIASLSSFAMHTAVFGGSRFGADFPGVLQRILTEHLGEAFFSLYGQGTAGDINHFQFLTGRPDPSSQEVGEVMAEGFLQEVPRLRPVPEARFEAKSKWVSLPLKEITPDEVQWANAVLRRQWVPEPSFMLLVRAWRILNNEALLERDGPALKAEIQAFRLGDEVAIVTLPHEIFVELGMEIKSRSPFDQTVVITMANDMDFYIPTGRAFAEGSYEIETSPLRPGAGERLVDATVELLNEMALD